MAINPLRDFLGRGKKPPKTGEEAARAHGPEEEKAAPATPPAKPPAAPQAKPPAKPSPGHDEKAIHAKPPGKPLANKIGEILEEAGLVSDDDVRDLIAQGHESAQSIGRAAVEQGLVKEDDLLGALARELHLEIVRFDDLKITPELIEQIPPKLVQKYKVFPVRYTDQEIWVALSDPLDIQTIDELKIFLNKEVIGCVAPEQDIARNIRRYYEGDEVQEIYTKAIEEQDTTTTDARLGFKDYGRIDLETDASLADQPAVIKYVDLIFKQAVHERASDIHVEPTRHGLEIRFRVDGVLHHVPPPKKIWQNQIIARLKVQSGMDLAEKRVPQDGRIKLNLEAKHLDLRVNCLPSYFGETIVMRILDQSETMRGLEDVGFLPDTVQWFKRLIRTPNGIILMTGPTGSGKTTTLYSALGTLNTTDTKIITAENPVEYQIPGIVQVQIDPESGLTFAQALRSMLRQSPDIILVGEIRDLETAGIAIQAALTGHLVFSTLHTNDAPGASTRLIDMGVKPYLAGSSLAAVIAQRLVRRICSGCKVSFEPNPGQLIEMGDDPDRQGVIFYKGNGCERCSQIGYRGRTAIHEIFELNATLRRMIMNMEPASHLKKAAIGFGMRTLRSDGYKKVLLGQTSFDEVIKITQEE